MPLMRAPFVFSIPLFSVIYLFRLSVCILRDFLRKKFHCTCLSMESSNAPHVTKILGRNAALVQKVETTLQMRF